MPCSARSVASIWLGPLTRQRSARQQVAFTRRFGEIEFNVFGERWSVPGSPEILVVSNATEHGRPIGVRRAGENWHSDLCYMARPPRGTML
jgi:taurine dioxygenase